MNKLTGTNDPDDLAQALGVSVLLMRAGCELPLGGKSTARLGINEQGIYQKMQLDNGEWRILPLPLLQPSDLLPKARANPMMLDLAKSVLPLLQTGCTR